MTPAEELLEDLTAKGLSAKVENGELLVGPGGRITTALGWRIKDLREPLIDLLRQAEALDTPWHLLDRFERWKRCRAIADAAIKSAALDAYGPDLVSEFGAAFVAAVEHGESLERYQAEINRLRALLDMMGDDMPPVPDQLVVEMSDALDVGAIVAVCEAHPGPAALTLWVTLSDGARVRVDASPFVRVATGRAIFDALRRVGVKEIEIVGGDPQGVLLGLRSDK